LPRGEAARAIDVSVVGLDCRPSSAPPISLVATVKNEACGIYDENRRKFEEKWGQKTRY
jgi:hypothetical protein